MPADEVLIVTGSMIGDVIFSTGAIAEILRRHEGARFTIVCSPGTAILFRHTPAAAEVIPLAKQKYGAHWFELFGKLRGRRWTAIYDFRDTLLTRLLSGPRRAPRKSESVFTPKVVEASSILDDGGPYAPRLWLAPGDASRLPKTLTSARTVLALGPGGTLIGKMWPAERFGEMAARLTAPGGVLADAVVVVTGGPADTGAAEIIGRALPAQRFVDMTGADLLVTAEAMGRSTLFVGNDTGMMHLAAASGAPTLGLFGPTDERLYGPWGEHTAVVRAEGVDYAFGKISKTVSETERQMEPLTVDAVVAAAETLASRPR